MKEINLRELYPDTYNTDTFVEVADEVWAAIRSSQRAEAAYERRKFRHKAHYSLDYGNGIEKAAHQPAPTPEELLEENQQRELVVRCGDVPAGEAGQAHLRTVLPGHDRWWKLRTRKASTPAGSVRASGVG